MYLLWSLCKSILMILLHKKIQIHIQEKAVLQERGHFFSKWIFSLWMTIISGSFGIKRMIYTLGNFFSGWLSWSPKLKLNLNTKNFILSSCLYDKIWKYFFGLTIFTQKCHYFWLLQLKTSKHNRNCKIIDITWADHLLY